MGTRTQTLCAAMLSLLCWTPAVTGTLYESSSWFYAAPLVAVASFVVVTHLLGSRRIERIALFSGCLPYAFMTSIWIQTTVDPLEGDSPWGLFDGLIAIVTIAVFIYGLLPLLAGAAIQAVLTRLTPNTSLERTRGR